MARINIELDERACAAVMRRYGLRSQEEAINFALRRLAGEMSLEEAGGMRGSGWEGDLDGMRSSRLTTV